MPETFHDVTTVSSADTGNDRSSDVELAISASIRSARTSAGIAVGSATPRAPPALAPVQVNIARPAPLATSPPADVTFATPRDVADDRDASSRSNKSKFSSPTRRIRSMTRRVGNEIVHIPEKLEPMGQFFFLRADAQPVYGLRDWTEAEWEVAIEEYPEKAHRLVNDLRSTGRNSFVPDAGAAGEARAIKERLGDALTMTEWKLIVEFQNWCTNHKHHQEQEAEIHYLDQDLLANYLFRREFPLGVEDGVLRERWKFAVANSGLNTIRHKESSVVTISVYLAMGFATCCFVGYMMYVMMGKPDLWVLAATIQDPTDPMSAAITRSRNKQRGMAASLVSAASFSLSVNGALDKFGLIDPSTSTVFIGMTLGGTWGFVLDNMFGSDEGFREYLWSTRGGMAYAMGSLYTERYGRYIVTILFDMFFTVILFKLLYSRLVHAAGFTVKGREWIANGFTSALISVVTFKVYANMTRFEWAYPSGTEDVREQWISGQTMLLATVIMNMVYLITETRTRVGEPGINDPLTKLFATGFTFSLLLLLQEYDVLDPSNHAVEHNRSVVANYSDTTLPLRDVCETQARAAIGYAIFFGLVAFCLAFVIFGTSAQSLSGLRAMCCCGAPVHTTGKGRLSAQHGALPDEASSEVPQLTLHRSGSRMSTRRNMSPVDIQGNTQALPPRDETWDRVQGKIALFLLFGFIVVAFVMFFVLVPLYSTPGPRGDAAWRQACEDNDRAALANLGLS